MCFQLRPSSRLDSHFLSNSLFFVSCTRTKLHSFLKKRPWLILFSTNFGVTVFYILRGKYSVFLFNKFWLPSPSDNSPTVFSSLVPPFSMYSGPLRGLYLSFKVKLRCFLPSDSFHFSNSTNPERRTSFFNRPDSQILNCTTKSFESSPVTLRPTYLSLYICWYFSKTRFYLRATWVYKRTEKDVIIHTHIYSSRQSQYPVS